MRRVPVQDRQYLRFLERLGGEAMPTKKRKLNAAERCAYRELARAARTVQELEEKRRQRSEKTKVKKVSEVSHE
jgi:hypothetical protein